MSQNQNNKNKKPMFLEVTEPEKFDKLAATAFETTSKLAKRINKLFSSVFADYHGSYIYNASGNGNVYANQQFCLELHFKPLTAGSVQGDKLRAFKPIEEQTANAKSDVIAGLKSIYGSLRTSAKFTITEEAAQILSEFMVTGTNIDPFNPSSYDQYKYEYMNNSGYMQSPVMVKVINLDLTKVVKKIYGSKNEDGKRIDYGIIPYGPVAPNMNSPMVQNNANWRVIIMQIESEKAIDLASEFGLIPANNNGYGAVITGTI